jgi:anti-sigma factor RsiW
MTCREFVEFLMQYVSGELSPAERTVFEEHMAECPECVAYLRTYEQTIRLEKAAFADPARPVPDEVPEDLVRAILAARSAAGH